MNAVATHIEKNDLWTKRAEKCNCLQWELGHVLHFFEAHCLREYFSNCDAFDDQVYDSFLLESEFRNPECVALVDVQTCMKLLRKYLLAIKIMKTADRYRYWLCMAHYHMHVESFYFTCRALGFPLETEAEAAVEAKTEACAVGAGAGELEFMHFAGGSFVQGTNAELAFDNEKPAHKVHLESFALSKTCVSAGMYRRFVADGGYTRQALWCPQGWRWRAKHYVTTWARDDLKDDLPALVCWYEACAFCRWYTQKFGERVGLPTESQWERAAARYVGAEANDNYKRMGVARVDAFDGVQMFGNVWEWCVEAIYPYDGFCVDKEYREMSYPFFGLKKICRGGAWCVPSWLATLTYRNAQLPDCRHQYIGFRLCKATCYS